MPANVAKINLVMKSCINFKKNCQQKNCRSV